jgi:hypothetical protein
MIDWKWEIAIWNWKKLFLFFDFAASVNWLSAKKDALQVSELEFGYINVVNVCFAGATCLRNVLNTLSSFIYLLFSLHLLFIFCDFSSLSLYLIILMKELTLFLVCSLSLLRSNFYSRSLVICVIPLVELSI